MSCDPHAPQGCRWELLLPYRDKLVRLAGRLGAGPESEDIVHEAMIAASQYVDLDPARALTFLVHLVRRRVIDLHRSHARHRALLLRSTALAQLSRSFEHEVVERDEAVRVHKRLARELPAEIMGIVWRHYVGGVAWADLANELDENLNSLKTRVHRALRAAVLRIQQSSTDVDKRILQRHARLARSLGREFRSEGNPDRSQRRGRK